MAPGASPASAHTFLVATDLDRTLIYSMAAIESANANEDVGPLACVEWLDGQELSFMTQAAARSIETISGIANLLPITTRTPAQFGRVLIPGGPTKYAITSNGGHILVDGAPDLAWRSMVLDGIADGGVSLADVLAGLAQQANDSWVLKRKVADELFCYLVVDLDRLPQDFLTSWTHWCAERGWVVSIQGRKIYALPCSLTKEAALAEVGRRVGAECLLAAGDGALDAGFLAMADAAIRPPHGELAELGWRAPNLSIALARGVLAGQEISHWLLDQVVGEPGGTSTTLQMS
ncbi:MAG: HAD family hydrolase [Nakamurella sp.]